MLALFKKCFAIICFLSIPLGSCLLSFPADAKVARNVSRAKKIRPAKKRTAKASRVSSRKNLRTRAIKKVKRPSPRIRKNSKRVASRSVGRKGKRQLRKLLPQPVAVVVPPAPPQPVAAPLAPPQPIVGAVPPAPPQPAPGANPPAQSEEDRLNLRIARNPNLQAYRDMGLTDLFSRGFYGQGVTVAVLETGFYHTVAPQYRQNIHNINIRPTAFDWYSEHVDQVLPPLEFCNPYTTPLHVKFEIGMGRQEEFRFYHGDSVASLIAEASPLAKILPVVTSLDPRDGSFAKALKKLSKREDVNVINMSRILETKVDDETQLNPRVLRALEKCAIKEKIITFSACNADNFPIPTNPTRDWINVQTLNNLNLNLIADFFENASENLLKHTIVSGALNLNSDTIAHYSTWAGVGKARQNYIATKGINYCSIFRGNWDGTSVSAPYTAATCANLLSNKIWAGAEVVESLFDGAVPKPHEQHIYGRGVMRGGDALEELLAN